MRKNSEFLLIVIKFEFNNLLLVVGYEFEILCLR